MNLLHPDTALALSLALSFFIPLLSALLRWKKLPVDLVGVLTLIIAAINGFFTEWAESSTANHYDWKSALGIALFSLLIAIAGHYGLWKGTSLSGTLLAVGAGTPANPAVVTTAPVASDGSASAVASGTPVVPPASQG